MADEASYDLVMPFVVCASNGGPYEDQAFVAGVRYGDLHRLLRSLPPEIATYQCVEYVALLPQLDLLAMHLQWRIQRDAGDTDTEWGAEWASLTFTRITDEEG